MNPSFLQWNNSLWLFDMRHTAHAGLFDGLQQPWEALSALDGYILALLEAEGRAAEDRRAETPSRLSRVRTIPGARLDGDIWIGKNCQIEQGVTIQGPVRIGSGCRIETGAFIRGPTWIGDSCEIRQGAYLRGFVLAGDGAVLGHACEFKHCLLMEYAQAPHFNYVGDSILGIRAHIGAGVILSNVRLDRKTVKVRSLGSPHETIDTGLEKFGAILGDNCEIGCNSVLNPGTILGARCRALPLSRIKGSWPEESLIE
ncbi:MAG: hypothetical protein LLF89_11185 [Spirochaetaceae bacterium]|nr:hypothetical protein [Spirochaetaceae bacterium]